VCCHFLDVLESTAVSEIGGAAGRAEAVIANRGMNASSDRAPADHAPGIGLRHGLFEQRGRVVSGAVRKR
jgi:hypothetical protein